MEINNRNGRPLAMTKDIAIESKSRIYPVTPDGSQWELRIHFEADLGTGAGKEIIGQCVVRSYNGGFSAIPGFVESAGKATPQLIAQLMRGMEEAQRRVMPVSAMPPDLKQ